MKAISTWLRQPGFGRHDVKVANGAAVRSAILVLVMLCSGFAQATDFPRIGHMWVSKKQDFLGPEALQRAVIADFVIINPNQGSQMSEYIDQINAARQTNPDMMAFRYVNVTELNETWNSTANAWVVVDDYLTNPNRGGADTANDGLTRDASGALQAQFVDNIGINIMDYPRPYQGGAVASDDLDTSKPKTGEIPVDYMGRMNFAHWVEPMRHVLDGVYEDVMTPWPIVKADWNNDGNTSQRRWKTPADLAKKWRQGHLRNRDNFVGRNFDGRNAPMARSNGRAWFENGAYFLGNMSGWVSDGELQEFVENGTPMTRNPDYDQQTHGGIKEAVFGMNVSAGGLLHDGTLGPYKKSLEHGLGAYLYSYMHARNVGPLGYPALIFQSHATTLDMARYSLVAGLMTDGPISIHNNSDGKSYAQWMLDEYVGEDYRNLSNAQLTARKGWLGPALDPAYPDNQRRNGGRVMLRRFQNGIAVILAGRSPGDDHLNAVETVSLPSPGEGYQWRRINGGQDSGWNDGSVVNGSVRLGTSAPNVNRNAIILRRVPTGKVPMAPVLFVE